jgi:hypothetical protein
VDVDGSSAAFSVAAILISSGPADADGDGNVFDDMTGSYIGDNRDGLPNYIRAAPTSSFDDLVIYVSAAELCAAICEFLVLAVNNTSLNTIYVFNSTAGSDIGAQGAGVNAQYDIISGTTIELWSGPGGTGSPVASTPVTPIILSGKGETLSVP